MAEFDDLMAGIRAQPHDELRRLVFADWLDENAHANPVYGPWAGYIRWAVAAVRTPRTDPDYWAYRRYPEPQPDGVAKLLGVEGLPGHFEWLCGFPDILGVDVDTLQEHDRRFANLSGPIRRLVVRARYHPGPPPPQPPDLPPWAERPPLPPVPTDWVAGATVARAGSLEIGLQDPDAVAILSALANRPVGALPPLTLRIGMADPVVADAFARLLLPSLVGLEVYGLQDPEDLARSPNLHGVKSFSLGGVPGDTGQDTALLSRMPNLTRLSLGDAHPLFLTALAGGSSPLLTTLECPPADAGTPGWSAFVASPAFERLSRLTWRRSHLDTSDAVSPADAPEPDAGELILNVAHLGPLRSVALFASPLLHRCECLFVENCAVTPEAYVALAANPSARNLKVLSIQMPFKSEPFARGEPVAALCRSPHFAGLTELSLTFHDLTDDDFEELLSATFAGGLRYLNLAGSYFSERLLERLTDPAVLPALTWLDIHAPTGGSRRLEPALRTRFGPHFAF